MARVEEKRAFGGGLSPGECQPDIGFGRGLLSGGAGEALDDEAEDGV